MLRATTEDQKRRIVEILDMWETCCHFLFNPESEDFSEYDDRIYLDGDVSFDKMAAVVDYLRACNPNEN